MTTLLYRRPFSAMGCPCETALYAGSERSAKDGFEIVEREVLRLDEKYSHYRSDSLLSRMAERASDPCGWVADSETAALLDYADRQYQLSDGLFDITTRRLARLWDRVRVLPDSSAIRDALELTGWKKARWDGNRLNLPRGFELDLGGVVKEYAADRAAMLLKRAGFRHGFVDLGGDFHVIGPHPDETPWRIGIRNPLRRKTAAAAIDVHAGGLASSGDYERYSEIGNARYSHFIDPGTGWAFKAGPRTAVSVVAPSCLIAGSMATLAMLFRGDRGRQLLKESGLRWLEIGRTDDCNSAGAGLVS